MARNSTHGTLRTNDPPLLIMISLSSGPKHGHALSKDIEEFSGARLGPGALYGAITRLEDRGLIEALELDERRRPYRLTAVGRSTLTQMVADLQRIADAGSTRLAARTRLQPRTA